MNKEISSYVLSSIKPAQLSKPSFVSDASAWHQAFDYAHRISSLIPLCANLERAKWKSEIPTGIALEIEEKVRRERMILAILDQELEAALSFLGQSRIPVMLLKGMDLGRRYYPERIFRPMTDVDLLVPSELFVESLRALGRGGFRVVGPFPKNRFRIELSRRKDSAVVEVHRLMQEGDTEQEIAKIWQRSVENVIADVGPTCRALSAEDNFVYLIRHCAVQHLLESPVWLNDLHYLIQSDDFKKSADWEKMVWALAEKRALSGAWLVCNLLNQFWKTSIPPEVLRLLENKIGFIRKKWLFKMSTPEVWFPATGRSIPWMIRSRLLLRDNPVEVLKYSLRKLKSAGAHAESP